MGIITNERGGEIHRTTCNVVDALTIVTTMWPTRVYNMHVMTQQFIVVH